MLAAVTALVLGVATITRAQTPVKKEPMPAVDASNAFACDLYRKLSESSADKSVLFSPYSISSALAMTLEGARGDTAAEMGKVLRVPNPGQTTTYCEGFKAIADRLLANPDPAKTAADRKQLADWRAELASVNKSIQDLQRQGQFDKLGTFNDRANKLVSSINKLDPQLDQFELKVANALWGDKTHPFDARYLASVDRMFGSGHLRLADFRANYPAERVVINKWVEDQTNNRIKDLLPTLTPDEYRLLRLVLINAIYFKGEWSLPFDEKRTIDGDFQLSAGAKARTKMMQQTTGGGRYAAFNGDGSFFDTPRMTPAQKGTATYPGDAGFLMAELPIKGGRISMVFLAPQKADGLPALEAKLTGPNLAAWIGKLDRRTVHVKLPRYKLETDYNLGDTLKTMGMRRAFSDDADFSAMTASTDPKDKLHISRVIHKAFVEVNEKGAEAAAATAVMMIAPTAMPVQRATPFIPDFKADRPFVFMIRDTQSGMVLFLGRVTRPS
jgi:serine protease inhibitor